MIEAPLVKQTSTTTGTGNLTLAAADTGFRRFLDVMTAGSVAGISGEDWAPYMARNADGSEWEFGISRIFDDAAQGELARTTAVILESSNAGALVNFTGDTTVRLIKAPNLAQYQRGVEVSLTSAQGVTNGGFISWDAETNDTDNCWSSGDPSRVYVPEFADEIRIEAFFEHTAPAAHKDPTKLVFDAFAFLFTDTLRDAAFTMSPQGTPESPYTGSIYANFTVNRSSVSIDNRAGFQIDGHDNSATESVSFTTNTRLKMTVVR